MPVRRLPLLLAAGLLSGCYQVPVTGRRVMDMVDNQEVVKLSVASFEQLKRRERISHDRARNEQLQRVGERIAQVAFWDMPDADWEFVVFDNPQVNAFAMAGGKVGVYTGLFKIAKTDDQLAWVIAHEIGHVTAKHIHEKLSRAMVVNTAGTAGAIGGLASGASVLSVNVLHQLYGVGAGITGFAFDRANEKEADYIGLMYTAKAGYDPQEAIKVLEGLELESASHPARPTFLSTHPSHPERIIQIMDAMPKALAEREKSAQVSAPVIVK